MLYKCRIYCSICSAPQKRHSAARLRKSFTATITTTPTRWTYFLPVHCHWLKRLPAAKHAGCLFTRPIGRLNGCTTVRSKQCSKCSSATVLLGPAQTLFGVTLFAP